MGDTEVFKNQGKMRTFDCFYSSVAAALKIFVLFLRTTALAANLANLLMSSGHAFPRIAP